ncbi:MgtC/SapB family protein [Andreprevotia chitinilytica]|uniref:MgtC/SapB family protein n=1 Tax=Andreprevotia chitinilytica TaxID=396808 RepID=UPI0005543F90|nr:MgtC/SapB family protein [Andreprevotia chitinilytica]
MFDLTQLTGYWSPEEWQSNLIVVLHLLGALTLGLALGYERSYHGRAAGMRTYALVCVASCALVVILGTPHAWFGGRLSVSQLPAAVAAGDPTRVIQGIVTGIGFLCAGVIMKEGINISGLTTAASMWVASIIGILVGVGFYLSAIVLTVICAGVMMWGVRLENLLPSHPAIAVMLLSKPGVKFHEGELRSFMGNHQYVIAGESIVIRCHQQQQEWHFVCIAKTRHSSSRLSQLAELLPQFEGVAEYSLNHARN